MKTKKRIWIITGILALLTTGMIYLYLKQVEASAQENKVEMSEVVVALTAIPSHVKVTEDMLEIKEIPSEAVHADTYTAIADVVGRNDNNRTDCRRTSLDGTDRRNG